jgi:hypothetical protein
MGALLSYVFAQMQAAAAAQHCISSSQQLWRTLPLQIAF